MDGIVRLEAGQDPTEFLRPYRGHHPPVMATAVSSSDKGDSQTDKEDW